VAKSKTKRKTKAGKQAVAEEQAPSAPPRPRFGARQALYSVALGLALLGGWSIWQAQQCEASFMEQASLGEARLAEVQTMQDYGRGHLAPGQNQRYRDRFPTSGPHAPTWTEPGFYDVQPGDIHLVHALEHGNVVIYYDEPPADALSTLKLWGDLYSGMWSGLVVARRRGLGEEVVMTAWRRVLRLKSFDEPTAAAFIDRYRGRGPENPVR